MTPPTHTHTHTFKLNALKITSKQMPVAGGWRRIVMKD